MALETLSYHKDIQITQMKTNVSSLYLYPLLQVEFRVIFKEVSYILLNGSKHNAIIVTYVNHKQQLGRLCWHMLTDTLVLILFFMYLHLFSTSLFYVFSKPFSCYTHWNYFYFSSFLPCIKCSAHRGVIPCLAHFKTVC